jgi:DNA-binding beta-propeller fold protein YncE
MFFGPLTTFKNPQGLATAKMIARDDPATEDDDDELVVYGVNAGRHQLIYNTSMWGLAMYGSRGSGKDQFLHPRGVATEPHGNVFVADSGNNRVVHLFNPLRTVEWVRSYRAEGGKGGGLKGPTQVALDDRGLVYVCDGGNRRIVVFDTLGLVHRRIVPKGGTFADGPRALAVADGRYRWSHFRREQALFCADRAGRRVWKFSLDGNVLRQVDMPGQHRASYGAIDYYHNFYVTDTRNHCVIKFDHNLELLDIFGEHGTGDNQFVEPRGIAIWKRYGQMFIAERKGAQYFWVGTDCTERSIATAGADTYRISLRLTEYGFVSLLCPSGSDTTFYVRKRMVYPGKQQVMFRAPAATSPGQCASLLLRVEPTYSSYTYYHWDYPLNVAR